MVWNVNPEYDDPQQVLLRVMRFAADTLDTYNLTYTLDFPDNANHRSMLMNQHRDLYLIFKEAVHNIVKHANATEVSICLDSVLPNGRQSSN